MIDDKVVIAKREFLNPVESSHCGTVKVMLGCYQYETHKGQPRKEYNGSFILGDCYRVVEIDTSFGSEEEKELILKKLGIIREHVDALVSAINNVAPIEPLEDE